MFLIARTPDRPPAAGLVAGLLAAGPSGLPSTVAALARGRPVLEATRAAGTLLGRPSVRRGLVAHLGLSVLWGLVLGRLLPAGTGPGRAAAYGALAGAGVAALDLGALGRRLPAVAALDTGPQVADHLAFGALAGLALWWADGAVSSPD